MGKLYFSMLILFLALLLCVPACTGKTELPASATENNETISEQVEAPTEDASIVDVPSEVTETDEEDDKDTDNTASGVAPPVNPLSYVIPTAVVETVPVLTVRFSSEEEGTSGFAARGSEVVSIADKDAYEGDFCLKVSNREATWNGPSIDMTPIMQDGKQFTLSAWLKYDEGFDSISIAAMLERNGNEYLSIGKVTVKKGEWTQLKGEITIPPGTKTANVYFETEWKTNFSSEDLCDFFVDSVEISEVVVHSPEENTPSLKEIYKDYFYIGAGIDPLDITTPETRAIILRHFDTITPGNQTKPDFLLDYDTSVSDPKYDTCPAVKFVHADPIMEFAMENGLKVRGHTLLWNQQTPRWLFTVGYSQDKDAVLADRETMLLRMENYIRQVLEYFQTNYPGVIYAWDVVNEAIETADRHVKGYRVNDCLWYQTVGQDYIEKAFEYARKYADPDVKLFYNDYNTYVAMRTLRMSDLLKELKEKGLVDGMGMQCHIDMDSPTLSSLEQTIRTFCETGVEVHITELDISLKSDDDISLRREGKRYAQLAAMLKRLHDEGLAFTNLTVWGIADSRSWLNKDGPRYPLLFDKYFLPKPAYWGVADPAIFGE